MVHDLKFYRATRPTSPMEISTLEEYILANSRPFTFSHDDENSRDKDGDLDHSDFIEDVLDYALGCDNVEGWTEEGSNMIATDVFLVVDTTNSDENVGKILWPESVIAA